MNQEKKYYKRSNGEMVEISTMETTHLINSYSKIMREIFENKKSKSDCSEQIKTMENLKEEYHKRFNKFYETLEDK